jgi:uncharacterized protein YabE (DUF348 family)
MLCPTQRAVNGSLHNGFRSEAGMLVVLSHNFGDMQAKLSDLVEESQKVGLRVNIEKTKDLRVNSGTTEAFRIGEEAIERVDDFLYLGSRDIRSQIWK